MWSLDAKTSCDTIKAWAKQSWQCDLPHVCDLAYVRGMRVEHGIDMTKSGTRRQEFVEELRLGTHTYRCIAKAYNAHGAVDKHGKHMLKQFRNYFLSLSRCCNLLAKCLT